MGLFRGRCSRIAHDAARRWTLVIAIAEGDLRGRGSDLDDQTASAGGDFALAAGRGRGTGSVASCVRWPGRDRLASE